MRSHATSADVTVLAHAQEIPGLGHLPVNAFLLNAEQPVLVDTGMPGCREEFLELLWSAVDPSRLRWVWLSHPDRDHTGSLLEVLAAAPQARVVTNFMGMGILSIEHPIPPDRFHLLNPGQALEVGDRTLHAFRPPLYDSPATMGFTDASTGTTFTSDCFGAPMTSAELALGDDAHEVADDDLLAGQQLWGQADSPWIGMVDRARYAQELRAFEQRGLDVVLSSHLPPARGMAGRLMETAAGLPDAPAFVGPDQAVLDAMLAQLAPEQRPAQERAEV